MDRHAAPARRALSRAGYSTLEQLATTRESEISSLHAMGPTAIDALRQILADNQLSFREED
jgi:hypothetical protein